MKPSNYEKQIVLYGRHAWDAVWCASGATDGAKIDYEREWNPYVTLRGGWLFGGKTKFTDDFYGVLRRVLCMRSALLKKLPYYTPCHEGSLPRLKGSESVSTCTSTIHGSVSANTFFQFREILTVSDIDVL